MATKKWLLGLMITLYMTAPFCAGAQEPGSDTLARWSQAKIWEWYNRQPWLCGFNYIPAYAINYTAMWDKTSFDAAAIDKELALAQASGMNVLRAVLQFAVYEDDPAYFLRTLDQFMSICSKRGIRFVPALFDDCAFGINHDPVVGRQPEPLTGWYAWAWSPSPGHSLVVDPTTHPRIEKYVKAVMTRFKDDDRILFWDLYNEPTNGGLGTATFPLLKKVIRWTHEVKPSQPVSISIYYNNPKLNAIILDASDLVSFHNYGDLQETERMIRDMKKYGRPVVCTEWMNRPAKSLVTTHLALFYREKVGCMLWGLVNGKTQTDLPWGHRPGDPVPKVWQHDLFRPDLSAYDSKEIDTIRRYTSLSQGH